MPDATERMTLDEYKRMRDGKLPPMRVEPGAQTKEDLRRESELQRDCENELSLRGIEYLHLSIKARERKGWPDLTFSVPFHREGWRCPTCCARGRHYAVELKTATGRLSDDQKRVLARIGTPAGLRERAVPARDRVPAFVDQGPRAEGMAGPGVLPA